MSTDPKNSDPAEETVKNAPATSESETEPNPADALSDEALDGVSGGGQYWQEFDNG